MEEPIQIDQSDPTFQLVRDAIANNINSNVTIEMPDGELYGITIELEGGSKVFGYRLDGEGKVTEVYQLHTREF